MLLTARNLHTGGFFRTVVALLASCATIPAAGFHGEGYLTWSVFNNGQTSKVVTRTFRVDVADDKWSIRTEVARGTQAGKFDEAYFDGTNLFSVSKAMTGTNLVKRTTVKGGTNDVTFVSPTNAVMNDSTGKVECTQIPTFGGSAVAPVWLAFCSGRYLNTITNGKIAPVCEIPKASMSQSDYPLRATWEFLGKTDYIPRHIVFWNRGKQWTFGGDIQSARSKAGTNLTITGNPEVVFYPAPKPFSNGFTNEVYEVLEETNFAIDLPVSGTAVVDLPLRFRLACFGPRLAGVSSADVINIWTIDGVLTNLSSVGVTPHFDPDKSLRTIVYDERIQRKYPKIASARYLAKNGQWLNEQELVSLPSIKSEIWRLRREKIVPPVIILVFIGVSAVMAKALWSSNVQIREKTKGIEI